MLLALVMVLSLAACGGSSAPAATQAPTATEAPASGGNLVGVVMPTKGLQHWNQDGENMKKQMEAGDYTIEYIASDPADNNINFFFDGTISVQTVQVCDIASVKSMLAGKQSMSVFKDTRDLATKTVEMVDALMKGAESPTNDTVTYDSGTGIIPSYLCEPVVDTKDDVQKLLIDSGWLPLSSMWCPSRTNPHNVPTDKRMGLPLGGSPIMQRKLPWQPI